ncbi:hypothetical protein SAMN05444484_10334 [Flavobacterium chilense]|uniref:Uncharacterized protein n=1 Tax=Flavobacterium chilense TaxID=946677 RepID=A0A1M7EQE9_9FLAO|nr:hypothetical protein SAMN05444484_10334 [Flavobacterium chilense]
MKITLPLANHQIEESLLLVNVTKIDIHRLCYQLS